MNHNSLLKIVRSNPIHRVFPEKTAIPPKTAERFEQDASSRGVEVRRIGAFNETGRIGAVP